MRLGFKMKLFPGKEQEYKKRHDELWPEMKKMIADHSGSNYSIFWDKDTNILFGYVEVEDVEKWKQVPHQAITQKWWDYMKDIMETNEDNSPWSQDLASVFYLP